MPAKIQSRINVRSCSFTIGLKFLWVVAKSAILDRSTVHKNIKYKSQITPEPVVPRHGKDAGSFVNFGSAARGQPFCEPCVRWL